MLKLISVLTLTMSSFAFASNDVSKDTFYTSVCNVAKMNGFQAAKAFAKEQGVFISEHYSDIACNGVSLKTFAKTQKENQISTQEFNLVDDSDATQLCAKAAKLGVKAVEKRSKNVKALTCNGMPVTEFVKSINTAS
ncbi:hypothetical protein [Pseudoalteromonas spongiae]|uniref:hypothetical protein n=1 Tax=Pseudoalteromonas spongiae TaxID=298657 RepID=UPI000C2D129F|nr:hypothetical protein [Pseudoalteromonas spongiae]